MKLFMKTSASVISCLALISSAIATEPMKVDIPFGKLDADTLNIVNSINRRLSKFSDGCSSEATEAADKLNRSIWASAACGASLGASETGIGLLVAAIACTSVTFAADDRVLAESGFHECKEMQTVFDTYKQQCEGASHVTVFESDKVRCVNNHGRLVYTLDFKRKTISIYATKK